jgi:hypothetical protein
VLHHPPATAAATAAAGPFREVGAVGALGLRGELEQLVGERSEHGISFPGLSDRASAAKGICANFETMAKQFFE